jgi:hypothetical protein
VITWLFGHEGVDVNAANRYGSQPSSAGVEPTDPSSSKCRDSASISRIHTITPLGRFPPNISCHIV